MTELEFALPPLIALLLLLLSLSSASSTMSCQHHEVLFLGKCWCRPGYERGGRNMTCSKEVAFAGCACLPGGRYNSSARFASASAANIAGSGALRCRGLCSSNSELGAPFAAVEEWHGDHNWKQAPFYKELYQTNSLISTHLRARLIEVSQAYNNWQFLEGADLGNVIEFGAGVYTQTRSVLEKVRVKVSSISLLDPLIFEYKAMSGCPYSTGSLVINGTTYPTTLRNATAEQFFRIEANKNRQFDTVIIVNVLVYSLNALDLLTAVQNAVKPGGLLLFHDRYFPKIERSSKCKTAGFLHNSVQLSKHVLDHFLNFFERTPYFSTEQTLGQKHRSSYWCHNLDDERGYIAAVRRPLKTNKQKIKTNKQR